MSDKLTGRSGNSTVVLTRQDTTHELETYSGGKRSIPAVKSLLEVDLDGDKKVDVRIDSIFNSENRGYASLDYKGKMVDILNPNMHLASVLNTAGVRHDGNGRLDPDTVRELVELAKNVAQQAKAEQILAR